MKKRYRFCSFLLATTIVFTSTVTVFAKKKDTAELAVKQMSDDEYDTYLQGVYKKLSQEGSVVCELNRLYTSELQQTTITVPEDGVYKFGLAYSSAEHKKSTIALNVQIDGQNLSERVQAVTLDKLYQDEGGVRQDGLGNQFAPEQGDYQRCAFLYPVDNETQEIYTIALTKGEHTLSVASVNDQLFISAVVFSPEERIGEYKTPENAQSYYTGERVVVEAETSIWKNSPWLISLADNGSSNVSPADPSLKKINYIGGSNWKYPGEIITWELNVPEDGYYRLGFSYRQSQVVNYSSYRRLLIDGECPFSEMDAIEFPYNYTWEKLSVEDTEGTPYLFYLEKGVHTIGLQVTLGRYADVCERMEAVVAELGDLNLKITMITGETVDISRDYDLFKLIPDLEERFENCVKEMNDLEKEIEKISGGESSSYSLVLRNMVRVIEQMLDKKYSAARYKNDFYTNYSSLSVCFSDMQVMPLDVDQIILAAPEDDDAYKEAGWFSSFFKKIGFSIVRFFNSFSGDYNSISGDVDSQEAEKLTLWVNWGQDQARVLNALIQTDFTKETGIQVEVQVVNASVVQAILSGNGPDVVLQQSRTEPVNLAMRGALYDLTKFEDYEEVTGRFSEDATTPYWYQEGLYALPDTQSFNVLFYRKDIFEQLGLEVPKTWEDFNSATKTILQNKLSVWLPYTQINESYTVNNGVGALTLYPTLLLQNNLGLYSEDGKQTTLTTSEALNVFQSWTDYYTKLKLPKEMNFYNRFRAGTCPMGIVSYSTAVMLTTEAPELDGLWGMSIVPGTTGADGNINYDTAGGGTGCSILNISEHKDAAWTFLKWWTSAETQEAYSTNLESILGPLGRVMVANTEALQSLSWTEEELSAIMEARSHVKELPEYPGGYQVSRSIDMAFYEVANTGVGERDTMTEWGKIADNEIKRKWEQYSSEVKSDED